MVTRKPRYFVRLQQQRLFNTTQKDVQIKIHKLNIRFSQPVPIDHGFLPVKLWRHAVILLEQPSQVRSRNLVFVCNGRDSDVYIRVIALDRGNNLSYEKIVRGAVS
jgi:hypothetical protein